MVAILIALVLLFTGVVVIYLLLKSMGEQGIDIAAPGSCRRGRCGVSSHSPVEEVDNAPPQATDAGRSRQT